MDLWWSWWLGHQALPEVTGIMVSAEDGTSNHQNVLSKFDELNYEVCHAVVCPSKMGLPMTRRRVYYQGLSRKVPDAKEQIARLSSTWQVLMDATYEKIGLDTFLDCEGGIPQTNPGVERDRTDRKWVQMHKQIYESHEAQCTFTDSLF